MPIATFNNVRWLITRRKNFLGLFFFLNDFFEKVKFNFPPPFVPLKITFLLFHPLSLFFLRSCIVLSASFDISDLIFVHTQPYLSATFPRSGNVIQHLNIYSYTSAMLDKRSRTVWTKEGTLLTHTEEND